MENRLEREIAYSADFFHSQVPRTKRYPVYFALSYLLHHGELCMGMGFGGCRIISKRRVASYACHASRIIFIRQKIVDGWMAVFCLSVFLCPFSHLQFSILSSLCWMVGGCMNACLRSLVGCHQQLLSREWNGGRVISAQHRHPFFYFSDGAMGMVMKEWPAGMARYQSEPLLGDLNRVHCIALSLLPLSPPQNRNR